MGLFQNWTPGTTGRELATSPCQIITLTNRVFLSRSETGYRNILQCLKAAFNLLSTIFPSPDQLRFQTTFLGQLMQSDNLILRRLIQPLLRQHWIIPSLLQTDS